MRLGFLLAAFSGPFSGRIKFHVSERLHIRAHEALSPKPSILNLWLPIRVSWPANCLVPEEEIFLVMRRRAGRDGYLKGRGTGQVFIGANLELL